MQIVINTIHGTYVVPREKEAELLNWLYVNATRVQQRTQIREQGSDDNYPGQQLLVD